MELTIEQMENMIDTHGTRCNIGLPFKRSIDELVFNKNEKSKETPDNPRYKRVDLKEMKQMLDRGCSERNICKRWDMSTRTYYRKMKLIKEAEDV